MSDPPPFWELDRFLDYFDRWAEMEKPDQDLRNIVLGWIFTRFDDPYQGMQRDPTVPNLWFGRVPGTYDGHGEVVCCSYWIHEATRRVVCDSVATLSMPI